LRFGKGEAVMRGKTLIVLAMTFLLTGNCLAAELSHQSALSEEKAAAAKKYPQIVLFSVAWCPHCKETKEYFTQNNIPFINRDVEVDEKAMAELTGKYNSNGVPVIVIGTGKNEVVVRGFTPELFQKSLQKVQTKK
jgi:glutaredoxin-like YruB-family protein